MERIERMTKLTAWVDDFFTEDTRNVEEMSHEDAATWCRLIMIEQRSPQSLNTAPHTDPQYVYIKRIADQFDLKITPAALIGVMLMATNFAAMQMFVIALRHQQVENTVGEERAVSMINLSLLFPNGFLREDFLRRMWDRQKAEGNLLSQVNPKTDFILSQEEALLMQWAPTGDSLAN
jgi:hypothetical protein